MRRATRCRVARRIALETSRPLSLAQQPVRTFRAISHCPAERSPRARAYRIPDSRPGGCVRLSARGDSGPRPAARCRAAGALVRRAGGGVERRAAGRQRAARRDGLRRNRPGAHPAERGDAVVGRALRPGGSGSARGSAADPGLPVRRGLRASPRSLRAHDDGRAVRDDEVPAASPTCGWSSRGTRVRRSTGDRWISAKRWPGSATSSTG